MVALNHGYRQSPGPFLQERQEWSALVNSILQMDPTMRFCIRSCMENSQYFELARRAHLRKAPLSEIRILLLQAFADGAVK